MSFYWGTVPEGARIPCNSTAVVLQDAFHACSAYVNALQTCTADDVDQRDRFQIVNQTALCLNTVFIDDGDASYYNSYINSLGPPPTVPVNASCQYPDFLPILQNTCAFDFSQLNYTACTATATDIATDSDVGYLGMTPWTRCVTVSLFQYWRCTKQEPYDDVASCVENTAVKADWLPIFEEYSGADSCPNPTSYLLLHAGSMLSSIAHTIVFTLVVPWLWSKANNRFRSSKRSNEEEKSRNWLARETQWHLCASSVVKSAGKQILTAYLTILCLQNAGMAGFFSLDAAVWDQLLFWVIRPRIAPFTGLLGFFEPFSETGLADVFADCLISWFAGSFVMANYWGMFNNPPANPVAPIQGLKLLAIGSLLSCVPAFGFLFLVMIIALISSGSILYFFLGIFVGIGFIILVYLLLPVVAAIELIAWGVVRILKCLNKLPKNREKSSWEQPLRLTSRKVFPTIYALMVLSSWFINVGNWIFLASFLELQRNMFCLAAFSKVAVIWYLVPLGVDLLFYSYQGLTQAL